MNNVHSGEPCQQAIMTVANYVRLLVRKLGIRDAVFGMSASRGIVSPLDVDIQRWVRRARTGRRFAPAVRDADDVMEILDAQEALTEAFARFLQYGRFCLGDQSFPIDFGGGWITVREQAIRDFGFERRVRFSELRCC